MSIFKDTFKQGVQDQIKARQEAIFERTPNAIQYYNSRNAWIRMSSAVDVGNDKGALAKQYVLLGGVLNSNGTLKSGIGNTINNAYSITPSEDKINRLGIRPMPGITGIEIKSKSAYGSLREIIVNFNAWDIRQLEDLELLYMRFGYSVLIEWGWAPYLTNDKKLESIIEFNNDVLNGGKSKEIIWKDIFTKASKDGNYDAMYGFIKNYSWSARGDGGYDCTVTVISMGEILESLKINYGAYNSSVNTTGVFGVLQTPFEENSSILKSYSQNIIAGVCNELYLIATKKYDMGVKTGVFEEISIPLKGTNYTFFNFNVKIENSQNDNADNDFDDKIQIYILLKDFIDILNKYVLVKDIEGNSPLLKLSVNEGAHMGGEDKELLCLAHPLQLSIDPSICLIKNDSWLDPSSLGFDKEFTNKYDTLKNTMSSLKTKYFSPNNSELGVIGNIFVNLGYLYSLAVNNNLEVQDKKEKNDIAIFDYIKNIMSGINTAIGNIATFDIFSDPIDSAARIIDVNYTGNRDEILRNAFTIQIGNTKSIVRSYKLESQIFPEQSAIVAIGAQAQGGVLASDTNTLIDFNQNLIDRVIPKRDAPTAPNKPDPKEEIKEKLANLKSNLKVIVDYANEIDPSWFETEGDYDVNNSNRYANALKDIINFYRTYIQNDTKNRGIIPTKLSIEMDGIGGIVIGNIFKISEEILPRGYKRPLNNPSDPGPSKIAYIVNGLGHSVQNNDWVTKIDAQFILLDEPKSLFTVSDLQTIQSINSAAITEKTGEAIKKLNQTTPQSTSNIPESSKVNPNVSQQYRVNPPYKSLIKAAKESIGFSTAQIPGTFNGNVGCAAAVSVIFLRATGLQIHPSKDIELSTLELYNYLSKNTNQWRKRSFWEQGKPGDVIITARGRTAGHTGIVIDTLNSDGSLNIISNSSDGFAGSNPGTIQQNYSIKKWSNISSRNPTKTASFEYIGPYT